MYRETRETFLTIFVTALVIGGGMYWFYNRDVEKNTPEAIEEEAVSKKSKLAENEVGLSGLGEEETSDSEEVVVGYKDNASTELETARAFEPQTYTNSRSDYNYSVDFPKNWYSKHYAWDGQDLTAFDSQPLPETSGQDTTGKIAIYVTTYQGAEEMMAGDEQWLTNFTKKTYMYAEAWPMTITRGELTGTTNVKMGAYITKEGKTYGFTGVGLTPDEEKIFNQMIKSFRFLEGTADNGGTEFEATAVFEPKVFTNKIYKYSIDFPKSWYWHHYGIQESDGSDLASFDSRSLPETLQGEYAGKVVIIAGKGTKPFTDEDQIAEIKKWQSNVTVRTVVREGPDIKIVRGEMTDGLSMGSTNVRMSAFLTKDNVHYSISIVGPTPEEEKIFEQMVASFRFNS